MAKNIEKDGFKNITEVRNFLYGLNNRKHSKVYVRVEQIDGYNYLAVWLDNDLSADEVAGGPNPQEYLNFINGFKKHYQMKINKVEPNDFLMETVQDITATAVSMVSKLQDGYDSRELFSECRRWGEEFEKMWNGYVEQGVEDEHDYMLEVEEFAEQKVNEYLENKN